MSGARGVISHAPVRDSPPDVARAVCDGKESRGLGQSGTLTVLLAHIPETRNWDVSQENTGAEGGGVAGRAGRQQGELCRFTAQERRQSSLAP